MFSQGVLYVHVAVKVDLALSVCNHAIEAAAQEFGPCVASFYYMLKQAIVRFVRRTTRCGCGTYAQPCARVCLRAWAGRAWRHNPAQRSMPRSVSGLQRRG